MTRGRKIILCLSIYSWYLIFPFLFIKDFDNPTAIILSLWFGPPAWVITFINLRTSIMIEHFYIFRTMWVFASIVMIIALIAGIVA